MQRLGDEFLAGSRLSGNQHRHAGPRQAADRAKHLLHRRCPSDQSREAATHSGLRKFIVALLRSTANQVDRVINVKRLRKVLERAALVSRHRTVEIRVGGYDYHWQRSIAAVQAVQQIQPIDTRHPDVGYNDVRTIISERAQKTCRIGETTGTDSLVVAGLFQHPANRLIVIGYPDLHQLVPHSRSKIDRQQNLKYRAPGPAVELDQTAVAIDQFLSQRQTEATATVTAGDKRKKNVFAQLRGNAAAIVFEFNACNETVANPSDRETVEHPGTHDQDTIGAHRLDRVSGQVQKNLDQHIAIELQPRQRRIVVGSNCDTVGRLRRYQAQNMLQQFMYVARFTPDRCTRSKHRGKQSR